LARLPSHFFFSCQSCSRQWISSPGTEFPPDTITLPPPGPFRRRSYYPELSALPSWACILPQPGESSCLQFGIPPFLRPSSSPKGLRTPPGDPPSLTFPPPRFHVPQCLFLDGSLPFQLGGISSTQEAIPPPSIIPKTRGEELYPHPCDLIGWRLADSSHLFLLPMLPDSQISPYFPMVGYVAHGNWGLDCVDDFPFPAWDPSPASFPL